MPIWIPIIEQVFPTLDPTCITTLLQGMPKYGVVCIRSMDTNEASVVVQTARSAAEIPGTHFVLLTPGTSIEFNMPIELGSIWIHRMPALPGVPEPATYVQITGCGTMSID